MELNLNNNGLSVDIQTQFSYMEFISFLYPN